jgi:hypothetical protein
MSHPFHPPWRLLSLDVTPCSLIDTYRRFGRMCCLHLQDRRVLSWASKSSHVATVGRSGCPVVMSSPTWGSWRDFSVGLDAVFVIMGLPLWLEGGSSLSQVFVLVCVRYIILYLPFYLLVCGLVRKKYYFCYIYTKLYTASDLYSKLMRQRHWTAVSLTAAKFKLHCRASPWPMLRTFSFSWFCMTSACFLHNFMI